MRQYSGFREHSPVEERKIMCSKITTKVLIVEDDEEVSRIISRSLKRKGIISDNAKSGKDALEILLNTEDQILLLVDYVLPDMNGIELIKELNAHGYAFPFISMTAHGDESIAVDMMKLGAREYIVKHKAFLEHIPEIIQRTMSSITSEKLLAESEEALRKSREEYEMLLKVVPDIVYRVDTEGRFIFVSESVRYLGYEPIEMIGKHFEEFLHSDDCELVSRSKVLFKLKDQITGDDGAPSLFDERRTARRSRISCNVRIRKGGSSGKGYINASVLSTGLFDRELNDPSKVFLGSVGIIRDITEELKADHKLRTSEVKFKAVFDNANIGIVLVDMQGKISKANEKSCEMFGLEPGNMEGRFCADLSYLGNMDRDPWIEFFNDALSGCADCSTFDKKYLHSDGSILWCEVSASLVRNENEKPLYFIVHLKDITEQKHAQDDRQKYEFIVNTSKELQSLINSDHVYVAVNNAYCSAMGKRRDEIIGKDIVEIWGENACDERIRKSLNNCLNGEAISFQDWIEFPELGKHYFDVTFYPYQNSTGEITHSVVVTRDVTETKLAKDALIEQLVFLQLLIDNMPNPVFYKDTDGIYLGCNSAFEKYTGRKKSEILGKEVSAIVKNEYADRCKKMDEKLLEKGGTQCNEFEIETKTGKTRDVIINEAAFYNNEGGVAGIVGVVQDITARKKIEKELKLKTRELVIMNNIDRVFLTDDGDDFPSKLLEAILEETDNKYGILGCIEDANNVSVISGITDECKKCKASRMKQRIVVNELEEIWKKAVIRKETVIFNGAVTVHDCGLKVTSILCVPIIHNDTVIGFVILAGLNRDYNDRDKNEVEKLAVHISSHLFNRMEKNRYNMRRIAAEQELANEVLKREKMDSLSLLAGGIAHDFNNILTAVVANISYSRMLAEGNAPLTDSLMDAERAAFNARDLTNQLLTFSKGGSPVKTSASLHELVSECTNFTLRGSKVNCDIAVEENLNPVEIDTVQISQVIHNLVINAVQAMPEGGKIRISLKNESVIPQNSSVITPAGSYVKMTIADEGVGIGEKDLLYVFDPFFTTKQKGSGLGLATTYSIVKKHGGNISVKSIPGHGTVFEILLPASNEIPARKAELVTLLDIKRGKGRILVMDDEEIVLNVADRLISSLGFEVVKVFNGAEALSAYKDALKTGYFFEAVIMDLTIQGGMGGLPTLKALLEIDPDAKVIVSSGYSNDEVMSDYKSYGFAGVIAKPYRIEELSITIQNVISKNLMRRENA